MTVRRHGLTLVDCAPYTARLTARGCADRWRAMAGNDAHAPPGNAAIMKAARKRALAYCAGCDVGERRSAAVAKMDDEGDRDE